MFSRFVPYSKRKKEFYKIAVARSDITASLNACNLLISRVKGMGDPLYMPLLNALIICYSRPFSDNRPIGALPGRWGKFSERQFQQLHNTILELRNKVIAHSDLDVRKVFIVPDGAPIGGIGEKSIGLSLAVTFNAIPLDRFPTIGELCLGLGSRLSHEVDRQLGELFGDKDLSPKEFELKF